MEENLKELKEKLDRQRAELNKTEEHIETIENIDTDISNDNYNESLSEEDRDVHSLLVPSTVIFPVTEGFECDELQAESLPEEDKQGEPLTAVASTNYYPSTEDIMSETLQSELDSAAIKYAVPNIPKTVKNSFPPCVCGGKIDPFQKIHGPVTEGPVPCGVPDGPNVKMEQDDPIIPVRTREKVAIVGFARSWVNAPFGDKSFEIWGRCMLHLAEMLG
jgi:hypothetical protein